MHLTALPKQSLIKWPYLKDMYQIDDGANLHRYAKTWKEAEKIAKELWPKGVPTIHHEEFKKDFPTAVFEDLSDVDFSKGFC